MFAKTLIAAAALTALTAGMAATASTAEAKIKIHGNFNVGLGYPGYWPVHGGGFYDDYYGDDCSYKMVKKLKWHNHGGFMHKHIKWVQQPICY